MNRGQMQQPKDKQKNGGMSMFYKKKKKATLFDFTVTAASTGAIAYILAKSMQKHMGENDGPRREMSDIE